MKISFLKLRVKILKAVAYFGIFLGFRLNLSFGFTFAMWATLKAAELVIGDNPEKMKSFNDLIEKLTTENNEIQSTVESE